jgi:homoserine dehydrogenase
MSDALKIGIAGLGTVGASLVRILQERHEQLATTCGRAIEITAVTARDRNRDRGVDLSAMRWHDGALSLAETADIDVSPKSMARF